MSIGQSLLFMIVSLIASLAGGLCGVGGGVVIKPALDAFGWASVSTIGFLSTCTVLAMTVYSVGKSLTAGDSVIDLRIGTPLALGSAIGGVAGKAAYSAIAGLFANPNRIGSIQAVVLGILTVGCLIYTVKKDGIRTHHFRGTLLCFFLGLVLGFFSSFLGIGGGPFNLVVLYYFFSMDTKTAVANSIYMILFCQGANLLTTVAGGIPAFSWPTPLLMMLGGVLGGVFGRMINKRIDNSTVEKLFLAMMVLIILICVYNAWQYSA